MEASNEKATLTEAFNKVEEVKKSIADSEVVKNETAVEDTKDEAQKSVEADHAEKSNEVEKSEDTAEKHVKDMSISDDNEKATKSDKPKKCGDDEVEESAHRSKHDQDQQEEANKSVEKSDDEADDADDDADDEEKSEKSLDPNVKPKEPKTPDKPKEISNIENKEGHEKASKSLDVMAKSLDAVVEMHKAYQTMAEATINSLQAENKSLRKSLEAGNVIKSVKDDDKSKKCGDAEVEESANKSKSGKCDTNATDEQDQQASKSAKDDKEEKHDDADEPTDKANKSVDVYDDEVEKSMPQGKAVSNAEPEADEVEKSTDQVKMGDLKNVVVKSISALSNTQESENLHKAGLLKSLYADIRDIDDSQAVSDDLINRYNNI